MEKQWIFSYGTLQDSEIQKSLFGYSCKKQKATLSGWSLFTSSKDGYLFIKPETSGVVRGCILEVDVYAVYSMDQWEEIPYYRREKVLVTLENGTILEVWAYTRRNGTGTSYNGTRFSTKDRESVMNEVKSLKKQKERITLPFCDAYIMVPCILSAKEAWDIQDTDKSSAPDVFLFSFEGVSQTEYSGHLPYFLNRQFFADIEIVTYSYTIRGLKSEVGRQRVKTYITTNTHTARAVVTIAAPACSVSAQDLLNQMTREDICLSIPNVSSQVIPMAQWLKGRGLHQAGTARALLILSSEPNPDVLKALLAGETDPEDVTILSNSISQQKSRRVYASENCVVEITDPFAETFEDRVSDAVLTLLKMERSLFHERSFN